MSLTMPPQGQYTVLRIKRKATEAPLSSLVISDERATKRRTLRGRGVFRLAETVPHTWRGEGQECEQLKFRIQGLMKTEPSEAPTASPSTASYRVVPRAPKRDPNLPPRVITNAEIEAARNALLFVDATAVQEAAEDAEMAAFLPMLKEYLKLEHGVTTPPSQDDDYVYDLYYRTEGQCTAGADVGALLGPEDEADEDSNGEDYYRNDYPEDEDGDEDMEGFHDAYSDGAWSHDSEADREEPDVWDYR
ncbi:hypothetical protein CcaverHIS002_0200570 [Cutaneotrichosporon cavernicola]|nr:hypothetical protein CcaverHIS002_0200570 [Cutaneotrichosporon cavernicola]